MNKTEYIKLAKLEQKVEDVQSDVSELKEDLKSGHNAILQKLENLEARLDDTVSKKAVQKGVAFLLSLTVLFFLIFDHVKDWVMGK